ncbi:recA bacterial DNA recombination protein [Teratosphaeria destructans]|uniref:RecA bacterial DNA recombination protein n=1 Tax=Teratosphaeria destructans TaxID=418781 RepID=A0A9W7W5J9_9PEZI|nr:recA bacterial DNA recombination protein [Teratosphaeria destructans]
MAVPIVNLVSSPVTSQARVPPSSPDLAQDRLPTVSASQAFLQAPNTAAELTGLTPLDILLHGIDSGASAAAAVGWEHGKVSEIWGPSGAGKTALLLQTAVQALVRGRNVVWASADTPLSGSRLQAMLDATLSTRNSTSLAVSREDCLKRFHYASLPTLSHLLAMILHPRPGFPPSDTSLVVIEGVNTLFDLDYPRAAILGANRSEQQRWQSSRRYAVLGSLVSGLNKLAVLNDLAVIVTTGCASRMRTDSGMGSALVPGVGGVEWDSGIWTRLVVFRDFGGRLVGLQKCQGRSLIPREEIGEVGKIIGFAIGKDGALQDRQAQDVLPSSSVMAQLVRSPVKARKRTFDEVADSEDEDVDEYGWADADEDALAGGALADEDANGFVRPNND